MQIGITERGDAAVDFDQWVVDIDRVDGVVAITKDPALLLRRLKKIDHTKIMVHCTVTGWGGGWLEPGVPGPKEALAGYRGLIELLGKDRVILRIDPIVPTDEGVTKALRVWGYRQGRTRISFLDLYPHVRDRIKETETLEQLERRYRGFVHCDQQYRSLLLGKFAGAEVCGEPGLVCSGCISAVDLLALGLETKQSGTSNQRKACQCLGIKTEMLTRRSRCPHGCLYCYWKD